MRLVSWNVNSARARLDRVVELLAEHSPEVLCLQETKCAADGFPSLEVAGAGYQVLEHGSGPRNGVAILAREGTRLADPSRGLPGEPEPGEARWLEATVDGLRVASVYVPNGREVGSEEFRAKLAFLDRAAERVRALAEAGPVAILGDLNVCRSDQDVYDPAAFEGSTHVTGDERRRFESILEAGVVDAGRERHPDAGEEVYTWWDYRAGHYHKRLGLRIDYALLDPDTAARVSRIVVDRRFRKGTKPSDHAPLVVDLAPPGEEPDRDPTSFLR